MAATIDRWWAVAPDETGERVAFAFALDELVKDYRGQSALPAFLDWLGSAAMSQEMYGETLYADPGQVDALFVAFEAGWFARKGEAVGYASGDPDEVEKAEILAEVKVWSADDRPGGIPDPKPAIEPHGHWHAKHPLTDHGRLWHLDHWGDRPGHAHELHGLGPRV